MHRIILVPFILLACLPLPVAGQSLPQAFDEMVDAIGTGVESLGDEIEDARRGPRSAPQSSPVPPPDESTTAQEESTDVPLPRTRPMPDTAPEEPEDAPVDEGDGPSPAEDESAVEPAVSDEPTIDPEDASDSEAGPEQAPDAAEDQSSQADPDASDAPLPRPRPADAQPPVAASDADDQPDHEDAAGGDRIYQTSCPAVLSGAVIAEALPPIAEGQCVERSPLSVTGVRVNGREVAFSSPATINCEMAMALPEWIADVDGYARARENAGLESIAIGTSQFCRPRNNVEGADLSEHGFANALDVVGFTLEDGQTINVLDDWMPARSVGGRLLRFAHDSACSGFTTVLGPEANALHEDHLHLDLGCHGQACTAQICE